MLVAEGSSILVIDRLGFASRAAMVEVTAQHLTNKVIVQVEDSARPCVLRLCYEIRPGKAAFHAFNPHGRQIGVFASVAALVAHAESVTGV